MRFVILVFAIYSSVVYAGNNEQNNPWVVGAKLNYKVTGTNGVAGSMRSFVREHEDSYVWMEQILDLNNGTFHRLEMKFDPVENKMLRLIQDGIERPVLEHGDLDVVEERSERLSVAAGTFLATYRKLRHHENGWERETWTSSELPINGLIKMIGPTELGVMTFELESYEWPDFKALGTDCNLSRNYSNRD